LGLVQARGGVGEASDLWLQQRDLILQNLSLGFQERVDFNLLGQVGLQGCNFRSLSGKLNLVVHNVLRIISNIILACISTSDEHSDGNQSTQSAQKEKH